MMKNIFDKKDVEELIARINKLDSETKAVWGKMDVARMLAHSNVSFELVYDNKHPKPNTIAQALIKLFVKKAVVSDKPFKKSLQTAPIFVIKSDRDFTTEKTRLIDYIKRTYELGASHFEGKPSHSFGPLTTNEWNNLFMKHLDHHLSQFGV